VEHRWWPAAGLSDQIANRAGAALVPELPLAEVEQAVRCPAVTHLVVEPGEHDVVALADDRLRSGPAAFDRDQVLRHDEE
jgi:hypothetical protein